MTLGTGLPSSATAAPDPDLVPDQVVAIFRDAVPDDIGSYVAPVGSILERSEELRFVTVLTTPEKVDATLALLRARSDVEQAYQARYVRALFTPNDPHWVNQWGPPVIGMPAAWNSGLGSHAVKVSIQDTGITYVHNDLTPNTFVMDPLCGPDLNLWAPGALAVDDQGHGTHVAGTVAAVTNNAVGVAGMSQSCIQSVKVLSALGSGTWQQLAIGVRFATDTGADIISMSLSGSGGDPLVASAVQYAWFNGVLLIAAAGNSGCPNPSMSNTLGFPAAYPQVMAVASLASATTASGFSSCGPAVEVSAPGSNIISTCFPTFGYCTKSGTSMATPHVSGVAALIKSHNAALSNVQLRCILRNTADDLGTAGFDNRFGFGRLDAAQGVAVANNPGSVGC